MSTAVIKSVQVVGSTVEVLAVADDGNSYRLQTDGTLASLKVALQQATKKADDFKTKPEITTGQTVDFTPVAVVVKPPTQDQIDQQAFYAAVRSELAQQKFASLSLATQALCTNPAWVAGMPGGVL